MDHIVKILLLIFSVVSSLYGQTNAVDRQPMQIHFSPTSFYNKFSLNQAPVLQIRSGDTVFTETIDAMGRDRNGVKRQAGGNPLTGPFYIEGAESGDIIAVTLIKVALNRPYAMTTASFVSRSMPDSISKKFKKLELVKWKLDLENGYASIDSPLEYYSNLKNYKVPLKPFPGCLGVAPLNRKNEILSFYPGSFGGNMDFAGIMQGSIIYLPVFHDGAFLYIGDGHAAQGDGEIAGNALETSLDVGFSVRLIKKNEWHINFPCIEDSVYLMSAGTAKTLDDALKISTSGLFSWLQKEYALTLREATQVMSTGIEYIIAEVADPEVLVIARIKKRLLAGLKEQR